MSNDTNEITAKIVIQKSYPLEKPGKWGLSGMFKVLTDDVSDDLRINLIKMEGKPGVVKLSTADETAAPQAEEGPTHTLTGVELLKRAQRAVLEAERMLAEAVQKLDSEVPDSDTLTVSGANVVESYKVITSHEDCDAVACQTYPDRSAEKCAGCDLLASVTPTGEDEQERIFDAYDECDGQGCPPSAGEDANAPVFASWEDCDSETCDWREDKSAVNCAGCPRLAAELPEGELDEA
jgi:hypothetical protein